jgi:hypothetical protein
MQKLLEKLRVFEASTTSELWITRYAMRVICPSCADKMESLGIRSVRASVLFGEERLTAAALDRTVTAAWDTLPKGWTSKSVKKFWESLTGDRKHKITACMKALKGKPGIDDPGAFCASLKRKLED